MTKRWVWLIAGAIAVVLVSTYVASPVMALQALKSAAEAGDAERLDRVVDFPAVRDSLKSQLNVRMLRMAERDPDLKDNPFAGLATLMIPALVDKAVDAFVTPDAIALMVSRGRAEPSPPRIGRVETRDEAEARITRGYRDLDTFVVASTNRADPSERVEFTFRRTGVFAWRLTRIGLPEAAVSN
jgi:alpha-beta hydrolase superfamily lysophospholipase